IQFMINLDNMGMDLRGMDANRYARQSQPDEHSLSSAIKKAEWMGEGEAPKHEEVTIQAIGEEEEHTDDTSVPIAPASPPATSQPPAPQELEADVRDREILLESRAVLENRHSPGLGDYRVVIDRKDDGELEIPWPYHPRIIIREKKSAKAAA
ncbi:MAG: hypothetical protein MI757_01150, partial [Pirellulales bacterium]|nr:hypothetical protein [Pirellulales bacterium]